MIVITIIAIVISRKAISTRAPDRLRSPNSIEQSIIIIIITIIVIIVIVIIAAIHVATIVTTAV